MASNGGSRSELGLVRMRNIVAGLLGVLLFAGALFVALPRGYTGADKYPYTSGGATAGRSADSDGCNG